MSRHHEPITAPPAPARPGVGPVPLAEVLGLDAVQLRAEVARLRAELAQVRRQRDDARAALSWIDSLAAIEVLDELDESDGGRA